MYKGVGTVKQKFVTEPFFLSVRNRKQTQVCLWEGNLCQGVGGLYWALLRYRGVCIALLGSEGKVLDVVLPFDSEEQKTYPTRKGICGYLLCNNYKKHIIVGYCQGIRGCV